MSDGFMYSRVVRYDTVRSYHHHHREVYEVMYDVVMYVAAAATEHQPRPPMNGTAYSLGLTAIRIMHENMNRYTTDTNISYSRATN